MPDVKSFRQTLSHERSQLLSSLGLKLDALASSGRVSEEDQATITHEEYISVARNRLEHEKLQLLNAALRRCDEGDFGICLECGEEIAAKRLKAVPWAKYCIVCQDLAASRPPGDHEVAPAEAVLVD
jgi:DnaK suppressor protein